MPEYFSPPPAPLVVMLDVDNTLVDNDRFAADLRTRLLANFGETECARYWALYAQLRDELGYADYLSTLQRFRAGLEEHPALLGMSEFLLEYPFDQALFPQALEALAHLREYATTVILSDGDVVFQPRKIQRSGIWQAVQGRVLIYVHKEKMLEAVQKHYPARHYVMVDDKADILANMKRLMGDTLTTIFVRQGHYAQGVQQVDPLPDRTIDRIADLLQFNFQSTGSP
jgi:FMN phosphatase YigB (HAD superfamily)